MTTVSVPRSALAANLICAASMLIWSAGPPAAELLIHKVEALPLAAVRMTLAAVVLLPVWALLDGMRSITGARWGRGLFVGGAIGLGSLCLILAQSRTDPVTVTVIGATMPVVGLALEVALDGRRMTAALILGALLSLLGGVLTLTGNLGQVGFGLGALLAFGSVFFFTLGSRWSVTAFPDLSPVGRASITLCGAAVVLVVVAALWWVQGGVLPDMAQFGWPEAGALAIFAIGSLSISQVLWIIAVGQLGIGVSSLHMNLTPFYVMLFLFALGGAWDWMQALGAAVVALGVLIAQGVIPMGRRA